MLMRHYENFRSPCCIQIPSRPVSCTGLSSVNSRKRSIESCCIACCSLLCNYVERCCCIMVIRCCRYQRRIQGERLGRLAPLKSYESKFIHHDFCNSENSIRNIRPFCRPLFCYSSVVKYNSSLLQKWSRHEFWLPNITEIAPFPLKLLAGSAPGRCTDPPLATVEKEGPFELLQFIQKYNLGDSVLNVEIMLRVFLTFAVSVATSERSFSKLKLIKNYWRSSMSTLRLRNLVTLSIEQQLTGNINFDIAIEEFANKRQEKLLCRRSQFSFQKQR